MYLKSCVKFQALQRLCAAMAYTNNTSLQIDPTRLIISWIKTKSLQKLYGLTLTIHNIHDIFANLSVDSTQMILHLGKMLAANASISTNTFHNRN